MSRTYERIAHFGHSGDEPAVEVYGDPAHLDIRRLVTVPGDDSMTGEHIGQWLTVRRIRGDFYEMTDGRTLSRPATLAMLANAAFLGMGDRLTAVVLPSDDTARIATYEDLGFGHVYDDPALGGAVLMHSHVVEVGTATLARAGYARSPSLPLKDLRGFSPEWNEAEAAGA